MVCLTAKSLGEAWIKSIELVLQDGNIINDEEVLLKEIQNLYITISEVNEDDVILKKYADQERIKLMKKKYFTCGLVGDYKIDYGSYIFNNNGVNQYEWLCKRLSKKPESKSATISLHKAGEDKLTCLSLLDFKIRDGKLDMTAVYRSQNVFSSQPGNIIALRQLQQQLASELKVKAGKVELSAISAHIYEKDLEKAAHIYNDCKNINNDIKKLHEM